MSKEVHYLRKKQIAYLQNCLVKHCEDEEERLIVKDMILRLKNANTHIISKSELAKQYGITRRTFSRRVHNTDELINKLIEKYGYEKKRQVLMPAEVRLIAEYLGDPPAPNL